MLLWELNSLLLEEFKKHKTKQNITTQQKTQMLTVEKFQEEFKYQRGD